MVRALFFAEKEKDEGVAPPVGFVRLMVSAFMACFFGCFRIRDRDSRTHAPRLTGSRNDPALSSLLRSDDDLLRNRGKVRNPLPEEVEARELKNEAKFLKACGTLPETPIEIRKASASWVDKSAQLEEQLNFNSWLLTASIEKFKLEKHPDQSLTHVKSCEEWVSEADCFMSTPSSFMTDGHNTRRNSISSIQSSDIQNANTPTELVIDNLTHPSDISPISPRAFATSLRGKNKSVRFEFQPDKSSTCSSETLSNQLSKDSSGSSSSSSGSKTSPYPTPLKLNDEMQTPGTVFPAYSNNVDGKANRVRSQYVYSVLNPIDNPSIWNDLKNQDSDSNCFTEESFEPSDEQTLISIPMCGRYVKEFLAREYEKDEAGQLSDNQKGTTNDQFDLISDHKVHFGRTPGDRPILGTVAAHWNDLDSSRVSPKWWDGNGIPNSTRKYKEDQKVNWHATPFEERLEKALSEDTFAPQRKPLSGTPAVEYNDAEESDTAFSQVKTLVSF